VVALVQLTLVWTTEKVTGVGYLALIALLHNTCNISMMRRKQIFWQDMGLKASHFEAKL